MLRRIFMRATAVIRPSAIIDLATLQMLGGRLAPRVMGLVVEWALQHRDELREDWRLARENTPLNRIAPLT